MSRSYRYSERRHVYVLEWLNHLDMKQVDLAAAMDTHPENINRWIKEPQRITLDIMSAMTDAMKLEHPGELFMKPEQAVARRRAMGVIQEANRHLANKL